MKVERLVNALLGLDSEEDVKIAYYAGDTDLRDFTISVANEKVTLIMLPRQEKE